MRRILAVTVLAGLCGCIEESPFAHQGTPRSGLSSPAASPVPAQPLPTPPANPSSTEAPAQPTPAQGKQAGAIFNNALQVVAYKIDPPQLAAGGTAQVTVFLRVTAPLTEDDMMFVHVDDAEGRPERVNVDHWPAAHKTPMPSWKVGEVVRDTFPITLNGFAESNAATIWIGFWDPQRDARMTLTNAAQVKNDGNNRYALADVPITH